MCVLNFQKCCCCYSLRCGQALPIVVQGCREPQNDTTTKAEELDECVKGFRWTR